MIPKIKNCFSRSSPKRLWMLLVCVILSMTMFPGCQTSRDSSPPTLRVGVALYTQDDTFIATVSQNLERMAQDTEKEKNLKINLSIADGQSNQTVQMDQVDRFLSRGCDVLCVNIVDRTAAAVLIDKAREAQVPLIFFNREPVANDIQRWEQVYYVGAQAEESGTLQGQLVADAWLADQERWDRNGDGILQYVMLEGEPSHQDALLRSEYAIKALVEAEIEAERLASGTANWNRGQAAAKMSQWLSELNGQIEVVFSNNDDMALGAIDAIEEAGGDSPLVVGVDATAPALEAVKQGKLYGTVKNDAEGISRAMLDLILALTGGTDPSEVVELEDGHYVWLPYRPVTKNNLSEFLEGYVA